MERHYSTIGDGSSGFVANGPATVDGDAITTSSTVVTINGDNIDMTAAPVGERREVDGFVLVRTPTGVKATGQQSRPPASGRAQRRMFAPPQPRPDEAWYAVEVRSHTAPATGTLDVTIGRLQARAVEFQVVLHDPPELSFIDEQNAVRRREAAAQAVDNIARETGWPTGKYFVTVRGRDDATVYVAHINERRRYTLRKHEQ